MAIQSQISAIVAAQLGRAQGEIEARIQSEAIKLVNEFANQCPVVEVLERVISTRNNLLSALSGFQSTANSFSSLANTLRPPIVAANVLIGLLKNNPLPVAIGTPPGPAGGLILSQTTGNVLSSADRLAAVRKLVESLENDVESIEAIVSTASSSIQNVIQILQSLDVNINNCVNELPKAQQNQLTQVVQLRENTGSEGTPSEDFTYRSKSGRDYTLAILEESTQGIAPKRFAVAKDNIGVIILRGQPSYSSDTKVLLDEIKFRIDNQLP